MGATEIRRLTSNSALQRTADVCAGGRAGGLLVAPWLWPAAAERDRCRGRFGSLASIIALLIAAPGWKSKLVHACYGLLITVLTVGFFLISESAI